MDEVTKGWRAAARARDLEIELPFEGGPMFFRRVPRGEFVMGSRGYYSDEEPMHRVEILNELYFGTFPVTQRQFDAFCRSKGESHEHGNPAHPLRPAENLDWSQAVDFCNWLNTSAALPEGWSASLPMEVEWEFACRAGTTTEYCSGDGEAALREVGWFDGNSGGSTHHVGELAANELGLYDMHGNVWEWCLDPWDADAYRARGSALLHDPRRARELVDPQSSPLYRVVRGGSFFVSAGGCRSAFRFWRGPGFRFRYLGFRVCLFPGPVVQPSQQPSEGEGGASARREGAQRARPSRSAPPDEGLDSQHLPRIPRP